MYSHFPDDQALLAACSAHWRTLYPAPDTARWLSATDPGQRLRLGLSELYAWYRETAPMTTNVLRDAETLPALHKVLEPGLFRYLGQVRMVLTDPFGATGKRRDRIERACLAASDVAFWSALETLGDREAAELGAGLVELAARPTD